MASKISLDVSDYGNAVILGYRDGDYYACHEIFNDNTPLLIAKKLRSLAEVIEAHEATK